MSLAVTVRALVSAGATSEMILAVVEAHEVAATDVLAKRRAAAADKKRRQRAKISVLVPNCPGDIPGQTGTDGDPSLDKKVSPDPFKETQSIHPPSPPKGGSSPTDFEIWYLGYPNKVGRPHAERAFGAASRLASIAELIEGRDRYIRTKPPDRPWCNPATWLNQQRWKDQPAEISTLQAPNGRSGFSPTAKFDAKQANLQRAFAGSEAARLARMGG